MPLSSRAAGGELTGTGTGTGDLALNAKSPAVTTFRWANYLREVHRREYGPG